MEEVFKMNLLSMEFRCILLNSLNRWHELTCMSNTSCKQQKVVPELEIQALEAKNSNVKELTNSNCW